MTHTEPINPVAERAAYRRKVEERERQVRVLRMMKDGEITMEQAWKLLEDRHG